MRDIRKLLATRRPVGDRHSRMDARPPYISLGEGGRGNRPADSPHKSEDVGSLIPSSSLRLGIASVSDLCSSLSAVYSGGNMGAPTAPVNGRQQVERMPRDPTATEPPIAVRRRRFESRATIGSLGIAATLLLGAATGTTITAPYHGFGPALTLHLHQTGCSSAKSTHTPSWMKKASMFRFGGTADSPYCPRTPSGNGALSNGNFSLTGGIAFASSGGVHSVSVSWLISLSDYVNTTPYSACSLDYSAAYSACMVYSEVEVLSFLSVTDLSNASWNGHSSAIGGVVDLYNYTTVQNYSQLVCGSGSCSPSGANFSVRHNLTPSGVWSGNESVTSRLYLSGSSAIVNKNDSYQLQLSLYIFIDTGAYTMFAKGGGHASAHASANLASGGRHAVLSGIVIT